LRPERRCSLLSSILLGQSVTYLSTALGVRSLQHLRVREMGVEQRITSQVGDHSPFRRMVRFDRRVGHDMRDAPAAFGEPSRHQYGAMAIERLALGAQCPSGKRAKP
jgi:hypothetical protein